MKRTLALAVACALVLEGCGESDAPGEARKKTVLEYASMKDIRNINPHLYLGEMAAQAMVFEPLVFNTPEGVKPALAERWEISGDGRTYTFHLRRGVKFTDGTPFTADAVKKNIDAVMANRTRHAWLDMINEIESSEVVDEHTWRLHLRHPYFPALIELGLSRPFRFISPACMKDGGTKDGVTCLAGTGPWVLSEHKDQQYALFSRNEGYWGDKPIVPTVRWNVVPDTQTMLMALEKGEIDLVFGADGDQLTGDAFKKLTDEKRLNTAVSEPIASRAILVNSKRPITKDVRVREALELFCDFYADFSREKAVSMLADLKIQPGDKISAMSKGTREKVQLVLVMSRAAGLYLLDEPIGGVDPAARDYILDTIIRNYSEDAALVLSTHLIGDIEKVLDDVVMIGGGRLVASGSVDELRAAQGKSVDAFFREVFKC